MDIIYVGKTLLSTLVSNKFASVLIILVLILIAITTLKFLLVPLKRGQELLLECGIGETSTGRKLLEDFVRNCGQVEQNDNKVRLHVLVLVHVLYEIGSVLYASV